MERLVDQSMVETQRIQISWISAAMRHPLLQH